MQGRITCSKLRGNTLTWLSFPLTNTLNTFSSGLSKITFTKGDADKTDNFELKFLVTLCSKFLNKFTSCNSVWACSVTLVHRLDQ